MLPRSIVATTMLLWLVTTVMAVDFQHSTPIDFTGGSLVVAWPVVPLLEQPLETPVAEHVKTPALTESPSAQPRDAYDLLVHFHGEPNIILREAGRASLNSAIAIVNFRGLSSAYRRPFEHDASLFEQLLVQVGCELKNAKYASAAAVERRLIVSSFSAGYGAVREILKSTANQHRIEGYVAADSIYASIVDSADHVDAPPPRQVEPEHMHDFLILANQAARGEKLFLITHSAQPTPYASTTETADYLINALKLMRTNAGPTLKGASPKSVCNRGGFQVFGYDGVKADDHLWHLRRIGDAFGRLTDLQKAKLPLAPNASDIGVRRQSFFDHQALDGWYSWLKSSGYEDKLSVFTVENGVLRISGRHPGYLASRQSFRDYQLSLEFRWGRDQIESRAGMARDAGLFVHANGPDGNSVDADGAYIAGIECQIMEASVGDLMLIRGRDEGTRIPLKLKACVGPINDTSGWPYAETALNWQRGPARPSASRIQEIQTWGRLNRRGKRVDWNDRFGIEDASQFEAPAGDWNHLLVRSVGDVIVVALNNHVVNAASNVLPSNGKLLFQSEGSEIFVRNVHLDPLR